MSIDQAPAAFIFLVNLIICLAAVLFRQREGTRFFQLTMGAALMSWSGGAILYPMLDYNSTVFIFPAIAVMLIPASFLGFAISFPEPLPWVRRHNLPLAVLYLPPLAMISLTNYAETAGAFASYAWKLRIVPDRYWPNWPLFYVSAIYLVAAAWVFNKRLREASDSEDRALFSSILYSFMGAFLYSLLMLATSRASEGRYYPAPSMLLALLGELGVFCAFRYLHETTPEAISRAVFLPLLALFIVFIILTTNLILEYLLSTTVFGPLQLSVLILLSVSISLTLALAHESFQSLFDRFFFSRAYRYRHQMRQMHDELREARERLSRAQRMAIVGEVAASVAHEIKNPLGPIKGYTQMMARTLEHLAPSPHKDKLERGLSIIAEEVDNINERVRKLLEFSKSQEPARAPCDLERTARRAADLASAESLEQGRLQIVVASRNPLPPFSGDGFMLQEAFFNIIQNAIQALGDSGRVDIQLRPRDSTGGEPGIEIEFRDDGHGIAPEQAQEIFKPFFTTREQGTGLGLGVVKNAIQAHRGEIAVASEPGRGTTVRVWLPAERNADAPRPPSPGGGSA